MLRLMHGPEYLLIVALVDSILLLLLDVLLFYAPWVFM